MANMQSTNLVVGIAIRNHARDCSVYLRSPSNASPSFLRGLDDVFALFLLLGIRVPFLYLALFTTTDSSASLHFDPPGPPVVSFPVSPV